MGSACFRSLTISAVTKACHQSADRRLEAPSNSTASKTCIGHASAWQSMIWVNLVRFQARGCGPTRRLWPRGPTPDSTPSRAELIDLGQAITRIQRFEPHDAAMSTSGFEVVSAMLALMVPSRDLSRNDRPLSLCAAAPLPLGKSGIDRQGRRRARSFACANQPGPTLAR